MPVRDLITEATNPQFCFQLGQHTELIRASSLFSTAENKGYMPVASKGSYHGPLYPIWICTLLLLNSFFVPSLSPSLSLVR